MNNNIDIEMGTSIDICMNRGSTIYTDMTTNTSIGMHMGIMIVGVGHSYRHRHPHRHT